MAEYKRHQGHRQRMRERVQNYGLDSLADHEVLEYVLYLRPMLRRTPTSIASRPARAVRGFCRCAGGQRGRTVHRGGHRPHLGTDCCIMLPQVSRYYGRSRTSTESAASKPRNSWAAI